MLATGKRGAIDRAGGRPGFSIDDIHVASGGKSFDYRVWGTVPWLCLLVDTRLSYTDTPFNVYDSRDVEILDRLPSPSVGDGCRVWQ